MPLSCYCGDPEDFDWWWEPATNFFPLKTSRRKRCTSCGVLIDIGADCVKFFRLRHPKTEIEERIYGEDGVLEIASWYMCEECGGLYYALEDLGFCIDIQEHMKDLIQEYNEDYVLEYSKNLNN